MKSRWLFVGVGIVIIGVSGFFIWKKTKKSGRAVGQTTQVVQVGRGPIEQVVEATGDVQPLNRVEVKPPISGRVEQLNADEGSYVRAGSILAWMSSSDRAAILDAARAKGEDEYKRWQDTYKPTPVVAPLSGSVILRNVVVGQTVDPSTILFAMSDRLIVQASVDESDIGRIKPGMKARLTLDAYPDQNIDGEVFQILQEGKNVSNVITYGVKVRPIKVPPFFRSQMTANVRFIVSQNNDTLLVPAAAVSDDGSGHKRVLLPGPPNEKPIPQEVQTGIESGDQVEITSGLTEGQSIVIVRRRYSPQQAPQTSPLAAGPRGSGSSAGGGQRSGGGQRQTP